MNVIVNADDLGMSLAVNDAIFAAHRRGLLRSATLLVHGPAFEDAVERLPQHPDLGVGVHLDTTEFGRRAPSILGAWEEQVARARAAGVNVSHVDSHQHQHLAWSNLASLRELCRRTGVRSIRGRSLEHGVSARSRAWRALAGTFATMATHFFSVEHYLACGSPDRGGWTELMVHPGNPRHARYAGEMVALEGLVAKRGWVLGRFWDL